MLGSHPLVTSLAEVLTRLRGWPVAAQQQARRNAMVAATACAQRRIEREEVADFLRVREGSAPQVAPTSGNHTSAHG
ncbi:MAG: hypothetical protein WB471_06910 [Nocardioides sp.]